jgi:DNA-binding transcriptional ArsR family regulator
MATHSRFDDESTPTELTPDTVFSVLSNERRRHVLRHLHENEESDIRELSQQLAAWENDVPLEAVTYKQRKRVYTSLHQTHLPALADAGVVDYDRDRGTVRLTTRASVLDEYLAADTDEPTSPPWHSVYLAIAAVGTVATLLAVVDLLPAAVPHLAIAGGVSVALAVVAGVHSYLASDAIGTPKPIRRRD